jgi:8-oxo-dGTP diphosphatase
MIKNHEHIGIIILILNNKNRILLGERKNSWYSGYFGLPGGRLESTETILNGASREVLEETGLTLTDFSYVGVVREWQKSHNFITFGFVTKIKSEKPKNTEPTKCKGWEWFSFDNLPEKLLIGHKAIIDMYFKQQKSTYQELL